MHEADQAFIHFKVIPDFSYYIHQPVSVQYLREIPFLSLRKEPLEDRGNQIKKRIFDLVVSLSVIIFILSWMIPLLGLFIYLESPGPIFFKQPRIGRRKKTFNCLKFRSMKMNNEAETRQAVHNDSRITRIGKFIRKTNLDEMPQFINVLRGDMSIVGPRPHPVTFFSMLNPKDDFFHLHDQFTIRGFVKPGVTGWAQVNGFRGEIVATEQLKKRIEHDLWYLENWSLWFDLRIMILTVYVTIRGQKNAF
jgi:putative colanic acid biosynthesis UDP-glucose lipid carrier transferase